MYLNGIPEYLKEYFKRRQLTHNVNLRDLNFFHIHQHKTAKFQCCYAYLAVQLLNNSDFYEMIQGATVGCFKRKYKDYLLHVQHSQ